MKTKLIIVFLLFYLNNIHAQEKCSLWNDFEEKLNEIVSKEKNNAYDLNYVRDGNSAEKLVKIIINSQIEERSLEHIHQNYSRDSLPNIRNFIGEVYHKIARYSDDKSIRKKAINYMFECSIEPELYGILLEDFDDILKKRIMNQYTRQFTEEELSFFAESYVKYQMTSDKRTYDYIISDTIKKCQKKLSYEDAKEMIFKLKISNYKQVLLNATPSNEVMIISGQLNLQEAIPYLKKYANDTINTKNKYAAYALAIMRLEDYEDRIVSDFSIDTAAGDINLARFINSQKVWYAYMSRLKSKKYSDKCPVAYITIRSLGNVLKDFPIAEKPRFDKWVELDNGMVIGIPQKEDPARIVPDDCGLSTQKTKTPINPDHIKIAVDWMEANKGKYELRQKIDRTF